MAVRVEKPGPAVRDIPKPPRRRAARWTTQDSRWVREGASPRASRFANYDIKVPVPTYDEETYEKHLTHPEWTKEETDYLLQTYQECNGKWPVIVDHYSYDETTIRTMEDLKARFYSLSATLLQLNTPITSMTAPEYSMFETLSNWNAAQEISRKKLAEGHLQRRQNEVDEESVLLSELQRIMVNQAAVDNDRDDLRRRLEYPPNTNGYQYTTSQALTGLWQQLLAADRMKKNQRLRPTGHPIYDGFPNNTPASARPPRDSLPSATPQSALPVDLSKADQKRFGVVQHSEKQTAGVTFPSDKISKLRSAKSTIQADKIATILGYAGVADLIPLATPAVVEQYEAIMAKVHTLLDLRKVKEKEEQEIRVREASLNT